MGYWCGRGFYYSIWDKLDVWWVDWCVDCWFMGLCLMIGSVLYWVGVGVWDVGGGCFVYDGDCWFVAGCVFCWDFVLVVYWIGYMCFRCKVVWWCVDFVWWYVVDCGC